jgi:hypothetical protein
MNACLHSVIFLVVVRPECCINNGTDTVQLVHSTDVSVGSVQATYTYIAVVSYICIYKTVQLKSKLHHTGGTRSVAT